MSFTRRLAFLALAILATPLLSSPGAHADWRDRVPVFRIGILGGSLGPQQLAAYACWKTLVERATQLPVELFASPDYAGVINGLLDGSLHTAELGAASYAATYLADPDAVEPVAAAQEEDGTIGYYSVMVVRADSPFQSLDDLRGRSLVFTDRNSTSGYLVPTYELSRDGHEPRRFFGRLGFSGSHPDAVDAVLSGLYDAGVTWTSAEGDPARGYSRGNLRRMVDRGRLDMRDIRIVWESGLIPEGPWVVRKDLPEELKGLYEKLMVQLPRRDHACFERISGGRALGFTPVDHSYYETIVDIRRQLRPKG